MASIWKCQTHPQSSVYVVVSDESDTLIFLSQMSVFINLSVFLQDNEID